MKYIVHIMGNNKFKKYGILLGFLTYLTYKE